ncbi:hypothetical protein V8E36_005079 [Tilletia maclaganii]
MTRTKRTNRTRKQQVPAAPAPSPSLSPPPSIPEENPNVEEGGGEDAAAVAQQGEAPEEPEPQEAALEAEVEEPKEEEDAIVLQPEAAELPCRGCYVAGQSCRVLASSVRCTGCRKGKDPCNVNGRSESNLSHTLPNYRVQPANVPAAPSFATDPAIRAALYVLLQAAARKLPTYEPPKTNATNDWTPKYLRERLGAGNMSVPAVQDYLQTRRRYANAVDAPAHVQPSLASGSGSAPRYDLQDATSRASRKRVMQENAEHIAQLERELKRSRKLQGTLETLDALDDDTGSEEESFPSPKKKFPPK